MSDNKKKSLIAGGLASSAGIFLTKAISILYLSPFNAIIGNANSIYYSSAYSIYSIILDLSLAGLPFAIATMVSKYYAREDYKSVLLTKKLGTSVLAVFGFVCAVVFFTFAEPIALAINTQQDLTPEKLKIFVTVYRIIALAIFTVPLLSSYRGFFQGLREFKTYSFSQLLEQLSRVAFLLGMGALSVYVFNWGQLWAVYFAVLSTSVSAVVAIIHLTFFKRDVTNEVKELSEKQVGEGKDRKELLKEMFYFSIPFLINGLLGNSMNIFNTTFFQKIMDMRQIEDGETIKTLYNMIVLYANKLTSIPQVLAPGFSAAIIPFITIAYENKDWKSLRKNVLAAIDTVLYIGLPLCIFLCGISAEIYFVMYGYDNYQLGGEVLRWSSLIGFFGMLSPVVSSLMMAVRLRKKTMLSLVIGFIIKAALMYPFVYYFGYSGTITSSAIVSAVIISINVYFMRKEYHIKFSQSLKRFIGMLLGAAAMLLSFWLLKLIGFEVVDSNRFIALIKLGVYGVVGLVAYFGVTTFIQLPQVIFGLEPKEVLTKITGKFKRS